MCPRQFPASEENALFSTTYVSSRWRDPVATCSALWNPEALASYNFIYTPDFPSMPVRPFRRPFFRAARCRFLRLQPRGSS